MTDIVSRLRSVTDLQRETEQSSYEQDDKLALEAADEIERLQAEVNGLRILLNSIPLMVEKYGTFYIDPDGKIHDSCIGKMIAHDIRSMLNTNEKLIIGVREPQDGGGNDH